MTTPATEVPRHLVVRTGDGVQLAVWAAGQGPGLVLVHGSFQDHTASDTLVQELRGHFTTYAMDRRGFGASSDAVSYAIDREFADVAAVVEEAAARTGGPVVVWGHSFGASAAMGGAALTGNISHLVLYEPSLGLPYPPGWADRVETAVTQGRHEAALVMALRDVMGYTDDRIDLVRASPRWADLLATAPTIAREARAEQEWIYPDSRLDTITAPTLLLSGSASPPEMKQATDAARAAIPGARVRVLDGHGHLAHRTHPADVAGIIRDFVST